MKLKDIVVFFEQKLMFKIKLCETPICIGLKIRFKMWIPVISTSKVSDGCIKDLKFNLCLH